MTKFAVFASAIVISSATTAWAAVTPGTYGSTDTEAARDGENQSNSRATAHNYPGAKAGIGQKKKTYMTPTANPMRTEDCSTIEVSGQATLNGQPMNGGASNAATNATTGAKAIGEGVNKGSGGSAKCWEERGAENPTPQ